MNHRKVARRRRELIRRDGGDRCAFCGERFEHTGGRVTVDHLVPESRGGRHELANLVLACATCNRRKGAMTAAEFLASSYLVERRRVREARERREQAFSHAALTFSGQGAWSCTACGASGTRVLSPMTVPCCPERWMRAPHLMRVAVASDG